MLVAEKSVVVVVDVQGKLADAMHGRDELFGNIRRLVASANQMKVPVIVTEQLPDKLGSTRDELADLFVDVPVIAKSSFSCCGEPQFLEALKASGKTQIVLCGIEAHICVTQTALELLGQGMEVYLVADAASSRSPFNKQVALDRMRQHGAEIVVTEMVMFEWLRDAAVPAFREVRKFLA